MNDNLNRLEPLQEKGKKVKKQRGNSTTHKNLLILFRINLKLTLRTKSVIVFGVLFLAFAVLFQFMLFIPSQYSGISQSAGLIKGIYWMVPGFFYFLFVILINIYLCRSQSNEGIHNIELRAGIPTWQSYTMRFAISTVVAWIYTTIALITCFIAAAVSPMAWAYDVFYIITPTASLFFIAFFFSSISICCAILCKTAVAVVISIMIAIVVLVGPVMSAMVSSMMQSHDDEELSTLQKMDINNALNRRYGFTSDFYNEVSKDSEINNLWNLTTQSDDKTEFISTVNDWLTYATSSDKY